MKILAAVLINNGILGAALALYLVVIWRKNKRSIAEHGWDTDYADPVCCNTWMICFIPIIGIIYYLTAGETVCILSVTDKEDVNGTVTVRYGPLSFHYSEDNKMN